MLGPENIKSKNQGKDKHRTGDGFSESEGISHECVLILDCVGLRYRFGLPDMKRDWQMLFRGERTQTMQYEKRTLGEPENFPLLREFTLNEGERHAKPKLEILPSDTDIHIFRDNTMKMFGTCDNNGNIIEKAVYNEIHCTPYGWYQGAHKEFDYYYPVIFNHQGRQCLMCTSLKLVDYGTYEATWNNSKIRFNLHLKILPRETFKANGITIYQISHNHTKLYSTSLKLGSMMALKQKPWGDRFVLMNNGDRFWAGSLVDKYGNSYELADNQHITILDGIEYVILKDGRMIGNNGEIKRA